MKVLVIGATGEVGIEVVKAPLERGAGVRALARKQPKPGLFPNAVEVAIGWLAGFGSRCLLGGAARYHASSPSQNLGGSVSRFRLEHVRHDTTNIPTTSAHPFLGNYCSMADAKPFWAALHHLLTIMDAEGYEYRRPSICKNIGAKSRINNDV